ncbi:MAG: prepilin-type N-terminal cleavage/methylation domain-containing protein [Myxococcales bacterium]|nr:prepilin-type N-terminal cleavage/methylation domain-containing protein [Myxococcales bacterium]HIK84700.1 prepilin-type N-terminal cleavage/methylation domain-containing protein [Myxococcales bacterium]
MKTQSRSRQGFTLIELMLAVSLLSIVIIGVFESLTRQHKTSIVTDNVVEVQQNVRAISYLIEREIRMAGFMVPNAVSICGIDSTVGSDELFVSETEPIVPDAVPTGDLGARVTSNWPIGNAWPTSIVLNLDSTTADLDGDGFTFYDNDNNGTPEADFRVGGGFILGDLANPHRGSACGTVTAASATQISIIQTGGNLTALIAGSDAPPEIVIVPASHYAINGAFATGRFERNGDLLAQGVDDFQISYFFDVDDDGVIDAAAAEEPGTATGNIYDPVNWDNQDLKEIRFSLVVRTRATDPDFTGGGFLSFENRTAGAGPDGFRRRVIATSVRPRNIGNSGSI